MAESFYRTPGLTPDAVLKKISPDTVRLDADSNGEGNLEYRGPRPGVDVCAFGAGRADPNDLNADDSPFFQAAINFIKKADGTQCPGLLSVPPGIYPLKSKIDVDRPLIIQGAGAGVSVLRFNSSEVLKALSDNVTFADLTFEKAPGLAENAGVLAFFRQNLVTAPHERSNWQFERCEFKGVSLRCTRAGRMAPTKVPNPGHEDNPGPGVPVDDGSQIVNNIAIVGCTFRNVVGTYAVELGGVTNATMDGCHVFQSGKNAAGFVVDDTEGIKVSGGSIFVRINTISNENSRDGIDIFDANQTTVANCVFYKNDQRGIDAKWNWLSEDPVRKDPNLTDRNIIAHNRATENGLDGISANQERTICIGNVCNGNGTASPSDGIYLNMPDPTELSPKVTRECIIANNVASNNKNFGIMVGRAQHAVVMGNVCGANDSYGIASKAVNTLYEGLQGNVFAHNVVTNNDSNSPTPRGISLTNENHRLIGNRSQDLQGAYLGNSAKFVMRERYGDETESATQDPADKPTLARWPVGVIVRYTRIDNSVAYFLRLPGNIPATSWLPLGWS
jgi:Right handed beta helix region